MAFAVSFVVYTAFIVFVGLWSARYAKRSDEDYFLAGRSLGPWVGALSASASSESGWVTLGLVGLAFTSGVSAFWIIPGCLLGYLFNWLVLADRMRVRSGEIGALTIPDFFARHFGERVPLLRILSVVVILTAMFLYVAAQLAAAGKAFDAAFDSVPYQAGVVVGAAIVLTYVVLGGFRAACWTDFLQALVMIGTLVIFPAYLLMAEVGPDRIAQALEGADPELVRFVPQQSGLALLGFLLGSGALGINFGYPGQPHVLVRFMALRDKRAARIGAGVSVVWSVLVFAGACTVGLVARALAEGGADWAVPMLPEEGGLEEYGLVLAAKHLIPGLLSGMVLAAVLAAICSTADSQLVVASSAAASDLYARVFEHSGRTSHLTINRLTTLALGVGAAAVVFSERVNVYDYVLTYGWAVLGASFGPQLILALLWKRATYAGAVAGMFTGFVVAIVWKLWPDNAVTLGGTEVEVYNLPLAFVAAMGVNVLVSLGTRRQPAG